MFRQPCSLGEYHHRMFYIAGGESKRGQATFSFVAADYAAETFL